MTSPNIIPSQYGTTAAPTTSELASAFLKVKCDRSGAARVNAGSVSVPSGTAANSFIGLTPFNRGARFVIGDKSVYCGNFGAGTTTVNLGYIYDDNVTFTNDVDAWASLSTAAQSGGFVTVDEKEGLTFVAEANGWIVVQIIAAAADATDTITWSFEQAYDGIGVNNSNNQA